MPGLFPPALIESVRSASDIVEVIGGYFPLKRAGGNFVALCPFHKEKSPSFNVNPQRQIFHCFGCHKGGDVFTFVQEYEKIDFAESVRRLADRAHIRIEFEKGSEDGGGRPLKEALLALHEQVAQRWQGALNQAGGEIARDYLRKRGVSAEAISLFRIGYAPEAWDDTVNWSKGKGYELSLVEQAGLILRKADSDHYYDRFRGRLIFPICDEQGRVVGFSGRILSGDEKTAKYVNSPETPLFTKGKIIFGLDKSKRALLDERAAIVCEGQLDLIACFMAGVRNIVAPQGTALTADHCRILKRYVEEVILCFDSDPAGQNAATRSIDPLLASGLAVRVAVVPAPHDPDSFVKQFGGDAFQKLISEARSYFDFHLDRLCQLNDASNDRGRIAIVRQMSETLDKAGNAVLTDTYAQKTAMRLGISPEAVRAEFAKHPGRPVFRGPEEKKEVAETGEKAPENFPESLRRELWLLRVLLSRDDLASWIGEHLSVDWLLHDEVKRVARRCLEEHATGTWRGVAQFLGEFENEFERSLITAALADRHPLTNAEEIIKGTKTRPGFVQIVRDQFIERELHSLNQALGGDALAEAEQVALLKKKIEMAALRRQPLVPLRESGPA